MFPKIEIIMKSFVKDNRSLFEKVAKDYMNMKDIHDVEYTILNYDKILNEICDFVEGYATYSTSDDDKYKNKVLTVTRHFYDTMFEDNKKYRKKMIISEFKDINISFLENTKKLQTILENLVESDNLSREMEALINLTNNQYQKVAKVHKDDMKIYLWLTSSNSKFFCYEIDDSTKKAFFNKNTPVIHKLPKTANPTLIKNDTDGDD